MNQKYLKIDVNQVHFSWISSSLMVLSLLFMPFQGAQGDVRADAHEPPMSRLDRLYTLRGDLKNDQEAYSLCETSIPIESNDVDLLWRCSRAAWWVGTLLVERADRLKVFKNGEDYGERAIQLRPDSVEAHFWLGGNYSSYGNAKGAWTSIMLISSVRREMEKVLSLQPPYMGGGADRILGILDYKVPGFMGGDKRRALNHLNRSLELDPANPVTLFYLADYYAAVGNPAKAKEYLQKLDQTAPSPDFAAEKPMMLMKSRELSQTLQ